MKNFRYELLRDRLKNIKQKEHFNYLDIREIIDIIQDLIFKIDDDVDQIEDQIERINN